MLTKNGALITDMRGKLGGQVYSKNRYGQFVCNTYKPVNPQSTYQQQNRAYLANVVAAWKQLPESHRLSWNSAAMYLKGYNCFGDSFSYTAYNCFVKCNLVYYTIFGTSLNICPAIFTPAPILQWSVKCITEQQFFQIGIPPYFDEDTYFFFYATKPLVPGRKPRKSDYRRFLFTPTSYYDDAMFTNAYTAYFGGFPPVGSVVHFKICVASSVNGIMSSTAYASAVCSSYLLPITPYNINQGSFDSSENILSFNANSSAFAAVTSCDFTRAFSFSFRIITPLTGISLRLFFSQVDTLIPVADSRNRYRWLYNPTTPAYVVNLLGAYLGGTMLESINNYHTFSYNGSVMSIYEGESPESMVLRGSFTISFTGVSYITFANASAVACQIDNIKFNQ